MLKKFLSTILLVAMILSIAQPIFAFSSTGTGKWVAGQYNSGMKTTQSNGVIIRRLTNNTTNEKITVFCAEFGVDSSTGVIESAQHIIPTDPLMKKACKIAYFGWYSRYGEYAVDGGILTEGFKQVKTDYVFTQQMIWETLGQSNATFIDSDIQNQYVSFKNQINSDINYMETKPSFSGTTITVDIGESITLTDTNGVLADYTSIDKTVDGIRLTHYKGENTMTVTVNNDCTLENFTISEETMKSWGFIKESSKDNDTTVFFSFKDGVQDQLYSMHYNDPVSMSMNFQVNLFGSIELSKLDEDGKLIDGAIFQVNGPDNFSKEVTVTNGKITIENLKKGTYTIKEKTAPNGYLLNTNTYTVEVVANQTTTQSIVNKVPTGTFTLTKKNADGSKVIEGTKYRIWNDKGYDKEFTTGKDGKITVTELELGTYNYKEIQATNGYLLDTKTYTFELKYKDQNTSVVYANAERTNKVPTGTFKLVKKNSDGSKVLEGTKYRIWNNKGYDKEFTTGKDGKITVTGLELGTYNYKEIQATNGYLLDTNTYSFELKYKDQNTGVIYANAERTNKEPTGTFTLIKKNADKTASIEGTKYRIWSDNGYDKEFTTNSEGKIVVTGLKMGNYNYKEIQASTGYLLDTNTYSFELKYKDQNTSIIYANAEKTNEEPTGTISIVKRDSETGFVSQGDAKLENAIYKVYAKEDIYNVAKTKKIYSKGDLVATRTTNEKGKTENVTGLPLGKYMVKEEQAPTGYMIDKTQYEVNLTYKDQNTKIITQSVTSTDQVKKMQVHIYKTGIKENSGLVAGLAGAEFTIKLNSDVEKALKAGYSYAEIWNGLDEYGNSVKVDSKRVEDAQKIAPTYETITTDANGNAYTQEKLPYGKYVAKETKVPKKFIAAKDFTFNITQDESEIQEIAQKVKHLVVNNEQIQTYIKLIKKDAETGKTVTLNSSTFEIKATEDIYDVTTGKIIYPKGQAITQKIGSTTYSSFTTNAENVVVPDNSFNTAGDDKGSVTPPLLLPNGSYEITEIKAPQGYLQLEHTIAIDTENVKVLDRDQAGECVMEVIINNEKPTGTLIVDKSIATRQDINTSLINTSDLSGIQFKLTAKEDVIDSADGSILYKKGQDIGLYNVDKNGNLKIENLPLGIYELQEIKTLDGLVLNNSKYEVKFTQKDQVTKVYTETKKIKNNTTITEILKKDATETKQVVGAKLSIIDENNKVIDTWTTTGKPHKIEGLVAGKTYILKEDLAPEQYVRATDVKFVVKNTTEIQTIKMLDKQVMVSKNIFATGKRLPGAELVVTDKKGNIIDKWISTEEMHYVSGLEEGQEYILTEITSPYGYEIAESINFKVGTNKKNQIIEMDDMQILKTIKILKADSETKQTIKANFKFGIYEDAQCTKLINEVESVPENGTVTFEKLTYGTYYIREIEAPDGYLLSDKIVKIEINDKGIFAKGELLEEDSFTYYNELIPVIQTGNERNYPLLVSSLLISLSGLVFIISKKKFFEVVRES